MNTNKKFYNPAFLLLIFASLYILFVHPWSGKYYNSLISWDKLGYYLYLPIAFISDDFFSLKSIPEFLNHYQLSSYWYQTITLPNGNQVVSYPIGIAIVQAPFFLLGYISAILFNYKLDGFSEPFVFWVYLSGLTFALIGIYYSYKSLCYFYSTKVSYVVILILFIGSNLFYYSIWDSIMPHSYLFGLYSIMIYNTIRWHQSPKFSRLLKVCFCIGLMVSMRATEIIAALIPVLWGVNNWNSLKAKLVLLQTNKWQLLVCIVIGSFPFVLQMVYWKVITDQLLFNPYEYHNLGFSWLKPHIIDFLISFRKGWLIYTPLMILSFLGFLIIIRESKYKDFVLGFILFSITNIYILSSWDVWWYGGSYGQRSMIQSYAIYIFAIAALLNWINEKRILAYSVYAFIGLCVLVNLSLTWQYSTGRMASDNITKGMFKEYLFNPDFENIKEKSQFSEWAWKSDFVKKENMLFSFDIAKNTVPFIDSFEHAAIIYPYSFLNLYEPNTDTISAGLYKWIRCTFEMKHANTEPMYLNNLVLVAEAKGQGGEIRSWVGKSFNSLYKDNSDFNVWKNCVADFEVPATFRNCDKMKFYFWMSGKETALVRNMKFYSLEFIDE